MSANAVELSKETLLFTEKEVAELLQTQRGNCYVAILSKTRNEEFAKVANFAPEPSGGKWRKAAMFEGKEIDINTPPKWPPLRDVTSYQNSGYISKWVVNLWFCSMLLLIMYLFYTIILKYF